MNRLAAVAVSQFPHPVLESFYRFRVDADACVTSLAGKAETEKAHPPWVGDPAFLFVYLQPQLLGDKAGDALHHPCRRFLAAHKNKKVVRITNGAKLPLLELLIEFIEYNIGKQGRKWATLCKVHDYAK